MNLEDARTAVIAAVARMDALYKSPVFNEWVLVSFRPDGGAILAYHGPRAETYKKQFTMDLIPLTAEMNDRKFAVGDFVFVQSATGTRHDVCVRIGDGSYLFCNHTEKSMDTIRENPLWLAAQKAFLTLTERFRSDPLV